MLSWHDIYDKTATPTLYLSQFKNYYFTEMCSGSEAGSFLRLIDVCVKNNYFANM